MSHIALRLRAKSASEYLCPRSVWTRLTFAHDVVLGVSCAEPGVGWPWWVSSSSDYSIFVWYPQNFSVLCLHIKCSELRFFLWWISKSLGRQMSCSSLRSVFSCHEIRATMPLKAAGLMEESWMLARDNILKTCPWSVTLLCNDSTVQGPRDVSSMDKAHPGTESLLALFYALTQKSESCAMVWDMPRVLSHCHNYFFSRQSASEGV